MNDLRSLWRRNKQEKFYTIPAIHLIVLSVIRKSGGKKTTSCCLPNGHSSKNQKESLNLIAIVQLHCNLTIVNKLLGETRLKVTWFRIEKHEPGRAL